MSTTYISEIRKRVFLQRDKEKYDLILFEEGVIRDKLYLNNALLRNLACLSELSLNRKKK